MGRPTLFSTVGSEGKTGSHKVLDGYRVSLDQLAEGMVLNSNVYPK